MEYRFDPYTRSFSAVYPEYYDAYYSAEDEEEAARRARKRRRMRNLAIGAGAAAAGRGGVVGLFPQHRYARDDDGASHGHREYGVGAGYAAAAALRGRGGPGVRPDQPDSGAAR